MVKKKLKMVPLKCDKMETCSAWDMIVKKTSMDLKKKNKKLQFEMNESV